MSRQIDETIAIAALSALAQPTRLDAFRRLIKSFPDEISAGELARLCKSRHNTMSTHLSIMSRARLIIARKDGRMIYYAANFDGFREVVGYLLKDCCQGRAEICAPLVADLSCCMPVKSRKKQHA
jgi:ArsR family transcriptional regulator, arsenate/arsenite/antimonite-responsive transcriptional repressor